MAGTLALFANGVPVWKGIKLSIRRSVVFNTTIRQSGANLESRSSYQASPRYRWDVECEFLYAAEIAALEAFFILQRGACDHFGFVDPVSGATIPARFLNDTLDMQHLESARHAGAGATPTYPAWWTCSFAIISVLNEAA